MEQENPKRRKKTLEAILTMGLWWGGLVVMTNLGVGIAVSRYEVSEHLTYVQLMEVMKRKGSNSFERAVETVLYYPGYHFFTHNLPPVPDNQFEKWYSERYKQTQSDKPKDLLKEKPSQLFPGDWSKIPWK